MILPVRAPALTAALAAAFLSAATSGTAEEPGAPWTLYDADPAHPWNRVHRALYERSGPDGSSFGEHQLDLLAWRGSAWLFEEPAFSRAIEALDAFLGEDAEERIEDPLARALFQRDLWAAYDFVADVPEEAPAFLDPAALAGHERVRAPAKRAALAERIGRVMRRVALEPEQIAALPDTLAATAASQRFPALPPEGSESAPFLPPGLASPGGIDGGADSGTGGSWVLVESVGASDERPTAGTHLAHTRGRSAFAVLLRVPGGRAETLAFCAKLREHSDGTLLVTGPGGEPLEGSGVIRPGEESRPPGAVRVLSPRWPALPDGSTVAFVRRAQLLDRDGEVRTSPLVESVQLRHFVRVPDTSEHEVLPIGFEPGPVRAAELALDRVATLADDGGGLVSVGDERLLPTFFTHGYDLLEAGHLSERRVIDRCTACHGHPGTLSLLSLTRVASGSGTLGAVEADDGPRGYRESTWEEVGRRARSVRGRDPLHEGLLRYWRGER